MGSEGQVGTLYRVALREVWKHEAHSFTTWMEENVSVLGDAVGLDLSNAERERAAGSFSVDIVVEDDSGRTVIIENQFGKSDHDHLGKLITYLTSFEAACAIWVVEDPRPEHVGAIAWLNEASSAAFYLVKVEAIRIDDSPAAPLFTLIVGPSEEAQEIGRKKKELSERHKERHSFWSQLLTRARERTSLHSTISAGTDAWIGTGAGVTGLAFNYGVRQYGTKAELYIDRGDADLNGRILDHFLEHRELIEAGIDFPVSWQPLEERRACRIASTPLVITRFI